MKKIIADLYNNFLGSLDNRKDRGFSGRKMSAFALITVTIAIQIKWMVLGDFTQLELVLTINYAFIGALFGMTTYQSMKELPKTTIESVEQKVTDTTSKTTVIKDENVQP